MEKDHAIASWTQGDRGGRALLRRTEFKWSVVLCSGDALKEAGNIAATGVPPETAARLAAELTATESAIPASRRAQFSRFEGTVTMDDHNKPH